MQRSTDLLAMLLEGIERELPEAIALRRRLHARPELAHAEEWTAATVAEALPVESTVVARTGRLALIGSGDTPPVGVRAELDGLPIAERTGAPFMAKDGAMHACGHDVHMAALVALARAAHPLADALPAPLLALFQPSEEAYPSGAQELVREELAAFAPAAVVAAHVHPEVPWGSTAVDPGVVNASCDAVAITVEGEPAHSSYPHRGRDPILAISEIVVSLHAQVSRRIDPLRPAVLTVGVLEGGEVENMIPGEARALATLRAYDREDRAALAEMVEEVVAGIAAAHRCRGSVELVPGEPPLENDPGIVAAARALLPRAGLTAAAEWRSCGSDDFSFFGELSPVAMAFLGLDGAEGFRRRPLHHPEFLPPDEAVGALARAQAVLYLAAASQRGA
jgi:amidohydrolase